MLASTRFSDDTLLAHAHREQRLAEHIVDFVRAGVIEVFPLKEDPSPASNLAEAVALGYRARPSRVRRV